MLTSYGAIETRDGDWPIHCLGLGNKPREGEQTERNIPKLPAHPFLPLVPEAPEKLGLGINPRREKTDGLTQGSVLEQQGTLRCGPPNPKSQSFLFLLRVRLAVSSFSLDLLLRLLSPSGRRRISFPLPPSLPAMGQTERQQRADVAVRSLAQTRRRDNPIMG